MKKQRKTLVFGALAGATVGASAAPFLVPNGEFSIPNGDDWNQAASAGTVISYEATGGNSGGFGKIDNTAGVWGGVLVAEGGAGPNPAVGGGIPLGDLGLTAGETYTFSLDMIDFGGGGARGGFKLESWSETGALSDSGDQNFTTTGSWATYHYDYTINPAATRVKVVPLVANNGNISVGFDNVGGDNTPIAPPPFVAAQIENGDFETANGVGWSTTQGTPSYPTTGGNPDGHVVLDGTGGFAVLYAFNGTEVTFESLGLAPGDTYVLQMDIRLVSGLFSAGYRLEGPAGFVVEGVFPVIGNGSTWETYSVELTVPAAPAQTRFGLRPGGSVIAFDNVSIIVPQEVPFVADIEQGTIVSWTPTSADNTYQAQKSSDGTTYTNLGPLIVGDGINSVYDGDGSSFYRVQESSLDDSEAAVNGGFETVDPGDDFCAQAWSCLLGIANEQFPTRRVLGSANPDTLATSDQVRTGVASLQLKVVNAATAAVPGKSLTQQNIVGSGGSIIPGNTYTFSFWANQVSVGPSYVQGYKLAWLAIDGEIVGTGAEGSFMGGAGVFNEISVSGLVAPLSATSALIEIFGNTGGVDGGFGEVFIDDISLISAGSTPLGTLVASTSPGVEVTWPTTEGFSYQVESSDDLMSFAPVGVVVTGDGNMSSYAEATVAERFFQVVETP